MKKVILNVLILSGAYLHAAEPAKPLTKTEIKEQIDTSKSIIKMLEGMKKDFGKQDPSSAEGFDVQIADEKTRLAALNTKLKTAPNK